MQNLNQSVCLYSPLFQSGYLTILIGWVYISKKISCYIHPLAPPCGQFFSSAFILFLQVFNVSKSNLHLSSSLFTNNFESILLLEFSGYYLIYALLLNCSLKYTICGIERVIEKPRENINSYHVNSVFLSMYPKSKIFLYLILIFPYILFCNKQYCLMFLTFVKAARNFKGDSKFWLRNCKYDVFIYWNKKA